MPTCLSKHLYQQMYRCDVSFYTTQNTSISITCKFPVGLWHLQIADSLAVLMSSHVNWNWLYYRPWTYPLKLITSFANRLLRSSRSGSATPLAAHVLAGKLFERPILATDFDAHWRSIAWSLVNCEIHLLHHRLKTFIALAARPKQELGERFTRKHSGMMHDGNRFHVSHSLLFNLNQTATIDRSGTQRRCMHDPSTASAHLSNLTNST